MRLGSQLELSVQAVLRHICVQCHRVLRIPSHRYHTNTSARSHGRQLLLLLLVRRINRAFIILIHMSSSKIEPAIRIRIAPARAVGRSQTVHIAPCIYLVMASVLVIAAANLIVQAGLFGTGDFPVLAAALNAAI